MSCVPISIQHGCPTGAISRFTGGSFSDTFGQWVRRRARRELIAARQTAIMRFDVAAEPIGDGDDVILAAVSEAPVAPMLAAVAHLTGELDLLRDDLVPDLAKVLDPNGGYTPDQLDLARKLATEALARYRDRGCVPAAPPDATTRRRLIDFVTGATA